MQRGAAVIWDAGDNASLRRLVDVFHKYA